MTCRANLKKVEIQKATSPLEPLIRLYQETCKKAASDQTNDESLFPSVLQFQKIALAQSLVVSAYSYLHSIFQVACSIYQKNVLNSQLTDLRDRVLKMGPELVAISWASGLKAASDYVKNADDWNLTHPNQSSKGKADICEELTDLLGQLENDIHQKTIHQLLHLGVTEEEIYQQDFHLAPRLVSLLKLDSVSAFQEYSGEWVKQVYQHFKVQSRENKPSKMMPLTNQKSSHKFVEVLAQSA